MPCPKSPYNKQSYKEVPAYIEFLLHFFGCYRFEIDEISPDDPLFEEGYCYWILSKAIKPQKSKTKTATGETENKENLTNGTVNGATAMATS